MVPMRWRSRTCELGLFSYPWGRGHVLCGVVEHAVVGATWGLWRGPEGALCPLGASVSHL